MSDEKHHPPGAEVGDALQGASESTEWAEIIVPVSVASAEDVAALIAQQVDGASNGTQIRSAEIVFWIPVAKTEQVLLQTRQAVDRMAAAGLAVDAQSICARPAAPETEWRDAWKAHFHVSRLTRQIVVVPSWESYEPEGDDLVIHLDPGQAFGTGLHASTRLVLTAMQELCDRDAPVSRFLDLGTGSGILSIAAAKLWPECTGIAVDIDPFAVAAARENAGANGIANRIECLENTRDPDGHTFDLVLANIQSDVLLSLCDLIARQAKSGATVVLSGLLSSQVEAVAASFVESSAFALQEIQRSSDDAEWSSTRLQRVGPDDYDRHDVSSPSR